MVRSQFLACLSVTALSLACVSSALAFPNAIEADPAKSYLLTKDFGPWMIMVATFHTTAADGKSASGKTPEQAAHDLIIELRALGLPAYKFVYNPDDELVPTVDTLGRESHRKNLRRVQSICVLAGNYRNIDEPVAQESLKWVKKLNPKCLREGVLYQPTKSRPTPLSGAFLTPNPLRSILDDRLVVTDPLLLKLNSGEKYSLFDNKAPYTLVVARFYGKSATVGSQASQKMVNEFTLKVSKDADLYNAGLSAYQLTEALRGAYDPSKTFNNIDAYLWHDRYESLVTVGSFQTPQDPQIQQYLAKFGPQHVDAPNSGMTKQSAHFAINGFGDKRDETRLWLFEPAPYIIRVPVTK